MVWNALFSCISYHVFALSGNFSPHLFHMLSYGARYCPPRYVITVSYEQVVLLLSVITVVCYCRIFPVLRSPDQCISILCVYNSYLSRFFCICLSTASLYFKRRNGSPSYFHL